MPLPSIISERLELSYYLMRQRSYGVLTSLLTALFPHSESYQVVPLVRFPEAEQCNTVIFVIKKRNVAVFCVVPTSIRGHAHTRSVMVDVARTGPHLPILYGISISGPKFSVYQFQEKNDLIVPEDGEETLPLGVQHNLDRCFKHDLTRERGEMKILEIVAEVKQMARRIPTPSIHKEFKARLPDTILWQFERIGRFGRLKNDVDHLHGPFTSLLTAIFSGAEHYQINPTISVWDDGLNLIVSKNYIPVFIVKIKPFSDMKLTLERTEADRGMREDMNRSFEHSLVPKIYGLVVMSTSYAVYEMCTATRSVLPAQIWATRGNEQILSPVTMRWWDNDLLGSEGFDKFLNIVSEIKQMVTQTEMAEPLRMLPNLTMRAPTTHKWQTLPADIILSILLQFLPVPNLSARDPSPFPWFFGHICRHWRYVFVSSAHFWSRFTVDLVSPSFGREFYPPGHNVLVERAESIVKTCLERSREHPLTFTVNVLSTQVQQPAAASSYQRLLEALVSKSDYWNNVNLRLHRADLPILSRANGQFPHLRSLEIFLYGGLAPDESLANLFSNSPLLSRLAVENLSQWSFNWSSLKAIKLCSTLFADLEGLIQMLQQAQSLEYLYLGPEPFSERRLPPDYVPGVLLPHLKILYIGLRSFLRFIKAPSLELLCVADNTFSADIKAAEAFLGSIRCLNHIILVMNGKDINIFLNRLPMVNHLHLGITDSHRFNPKLLSIHNTPNLCNLKKLSFSFSTRGTSLFEVMAGEIPAWKRNSDGTFDTPGVQHETLPALEALTLNIIWERQANEWDCSDIDEIKRLCEEKEILLDMASVNRLIPTLPNPFGRCYPFRHGI